MNLNDYGLDTVCKMHNINPIGEYPIEWIDACELVVPERLDLVSKLLYVDYHERRLEGTFAVELYKRDLEVCTSGTFNEYGNDAKNTFADYCKIFDAMIDEIKKTGINPKQSIIPIDAHGVIMDGAHRTAIAAYFGQKVPVIQFDVMSPAMGAELYKKRLARDSDIEFALTEMCKWNKDIYLCCMWPAAENDAQREEAIKILNNETTIFYRKTIDLSIKGLCNLIPQIYVSHSWTGGIENRFISAAPKIEGCNGKGKLDVILFRSDSLDNVKSIKKQMRDIFGLAENSLHITDYTSETLELSQMLLNQNSVAFLNKADPFLFIDLNKRLHTFKQGILNSNASLDEYIVESSSVMGLYGIRKPSDLDYLSTNKTDLDFEDETINNHEEEAIYHGRSVSDIVNDPTSYFYYFGIKFLTLDALVEFKRTRNSIKDREDLLLINDYLENKHKFRRTVVETFQTFRRKGRNAVYIILRSIPGGYDCARAVYHFFRD